MESPKKISSQKERGSSEAAQGTSQNVTSLANQTPTKDNQIGNINKENSLNSVKNQIKISEPAFSGQLYEIVLLMFLIFESYTKRKNKGFSFHLGTNIKQGFDFDDVVYKSSNKGKDGKDKSQVIFLQAKHKSSRTEVSLDTLFHSGKGVDFSLRKYLRSFLETKEVFKNPAQHEVFSGNFDDCRFIIYTNAPLKTQTENDHFTSHVLQPGNALYLEEHKKFYKINFNAVTEKELKELKKLKNEQNVDTVEVKDFLAKLELRTNQPTEEGLSKTIKKMIQSAYSSSSHHSITEDDVSFAFFHMKTTVEQWWKEKGLSTFLNETNTIFQDSMRISIRFDVREPTALFVGRTGELDELHKILQKKTQLSQITCISGLGGIGKTEFTIKYINDYESCYHGNIFWINAESEQTCAESFRRLAELKLGIRTINSDKKEKDMKTIKDEVYTFFLSRSRKSLFVFDNADENDFLLKFLPLLPPNQTECAFKPQLLTSRLQEWRTVQGCVIEVFSLRELKAEEAVQFVKKGLKILEDDVTKNSVIKTLVDKLQYYPLAIRQAIAYIDCQNGKKLYEITNYIKDFEMKKEEFLNSQQRGGIDNAYYPTTFTTWSLTVDKIKKNTDFGQLAIEVLNVIAYFAPYKIKRDLFLDIGGSVTQVKEAVRLLIKYSMINFEQKQSILFIHRLVQEVTRINLEKHGQKEITLKKALQILNKKTLETENVDHAVSSWTFAGEHGELVRKFTKLPPQVVLILHDCVRLAEAYSFGEKALASLKCFQGEEDCLDDILNLEQSVAGVLNSQGKYKEAHEKYKSVFDKFTTEFGFNDRRTLGTRHHIAQTLAYRGQYQKALVEFKIILEEQKIALEDNDEDILSTTRSVAGLLGEMGKYEEALLMYADLPTDRLQDHHNYTVILDRLGKYDEAIQRYQDIVKIKMKKFGEKHLSTMATKHNLAGLLQNGFEFDEALKMYEEVLEVRKEVLGPTHRDTCATENCMAMLLADQGSYNEALSKYEEVLSKMVASLGSDHPDSLTVRNNKGTALEKLGRYDEALDVFQYVLDQRLHIFGKEHHDTLLTRNNIAVVMESKGQYKEACKEHMEIHKLKRKVFGPDHLSTLKSQHNLASVLESQGKCDEALKEYEDVLKRRTKQLKLNHPDILSTKNNIAVVHLRLKQYDKALPLLEEVLKEQSNCLSPNHMNLLATRTNMERALAGLQKIP